MNIKERVLASMKTSYAKYGFKKEELNSLTDIISANLTEESTDEQVTAALKAAEGYAQMMQTVYNRGISETNKKYEGYVKPTEPPAPPVVPPVTPPVTPPSGTLTLEQVQEMIQQANADRQKEIDAAVAKATAPFLQKQEQDRLANLLASHDKLKDIPKSFASKYRLEKEEDLDAMAERIETEFTDLQQELVRSGRFVEAPAPSSPQSETDDFIKTMEGFAERNAPKPEPAK